MWANEEAEFEKKAEKHFRGYRMFPDGRDFRAFKGGSRSDINNEQFDENWDKTFPGSPGNFNKFGRYCDNCDRLKSMCVCR